MKKIATMAMVVIGLLMLHVPSASASRMIYTEHKHTGIHRDHDTIYGKYHNYASVHWNWGWYGGDSPFGHHAWARPTEAWVSVDAPGFLEPCGILDGYNGTSFRFSFSNPATGYHFVGQWHTLPCARDTGNGMWIDISSRVARMRYVDFDLAPRFRVEIRTHLDQYPDPKSSDVAIFHRV